MPKRKKPGRGKPRGGSKKKRTDELSPARSQTQDADSDHGDFNSPNGTPEKTPNKGQGKMSNRSNRSLKRGATNSKRNSSQESNKSSRSNRSQVHSDGVSDQPPEADVVQSAHPNSVEFLDEDGVKFNVTREEEQDLGVTEEEVHTQANNNAHPDKSAKIKCSLRIPSSDEDSTDFSDSESDFTTSSSESGSSSDREEDISDKGRKRGQKERRFQLGDWHSLERVMPQLQSLLQSHEDLLAEVKQL